MFDGIVIKIRWEHSVDYALTQTTWEKYFYLWPRRCVKTQKWLWLKHHYRGVRSVRHGDTFVDEVYNMHRDKFIIWKLKQ